MLKAVIGLLQYEAIIVVILQCNITGNRGRERLTYQYNLIPTTSIKVLKSYRCEPSYIADLRRTSGSIYGQVLLNQV